MSSVVVWRDRLGLVEVAWNKESAPSISYDFDSADGGCHAERVYEATIPAALETGFSMMRDVHLQAVRAAMQLPETGGVQSLNTTEENRPNLPRGLAISNGPDGILVHHMEPGGQDAIQLPIAVVTDDETAARLVSGIMVLAERRTIDMVVSQLDEEFSIEGRNDYWEIARTFRPTAEQISEFVRDPAGGIALDGDRQKDGFDTQTIIVAIVEDTIVSWLEKRYPLVVVQAHAPTP